MFADAEEIKANLVGELDGFEQIAHGFRGRAESREAHVLGALSSAERATFRELLQRLAARATVLDPAESPCDVVTDVDAALSANASGTQAPGAKRRAARHRQTV
jgi:hypothetical protein